MLLLTRQIDESVIIGRAIQVKVIRISEDKVTLGFVAQSHVEIDREEVARKKGWKGIKKGVCSLLATAFLSLGAQAAGITTVTGHLQKASSQAMTNTILTFTPESTPLTDIPFLTSGDIIRSTSTPPVGFFTIDLEQGIYKVQIGGNRRDTFQVTIPDATETNHIEAYVTSGATTNFIPGSVSGWTQTASDARYVQKTNSWAIDLTITNVSIDPGQGSVGEVLTVTNAATGEAHWAPAPGAGGGVDNSGANLVAESAGIRHIYVGDSGDDLQFRPLAVLGSLSIFTNAAGLVIVSNEFGVTTNGPSLHSPTFLTSATLDYATANRALVTDANKVPTNSPVTDVELGHLSGVTSALQAQIDGKNPLNTNLVNFLDPRWAWQFTIGPTVTMVTNITHYFIEAPGQNVPVTVPNPNLFFGTAETGDAYGTPMFIWPFGDTTFSLTNQYGNMERSSEPAVQANFFQMSSNAVMLMPVSSTFWYVLEFEKGMGNSLMDPGANGLLSRTSDTIVTARSIVGSTDLHVADGDGVAGNPTITVTNATGTGSIMKSNAPSLNTPTVSSWVDVISGGVTNRITHDTIGPRTSDDLIFQVADTDVVRITSSGMLAPIFDSLSILGEATVRWLRIWGDEINGLNVNGSVLKATNSVILPLLDSDPNIDGQLRVDTNATGGMVLKYYYNGTVFTIPGATNSPSNGDVLSYSGSADRYHYDAIGGGGSAEDDSVTVNGNNTTDPDLTNAVDLLSVDAIGIDWHMSGDGQRIVGDFKIDTSHFAIDGPTNKLTMAVRHHSFTVNAGAMRPEQTDGPTSVTVEEGNYQTTSDFYEFADTGSNGVQFTWIAPPNWNLGAFKMRLYHSTTNDATGQTNVYEVSAKAIGPNESLTNTAWGTPITVTNHITSSNTVLRSTTMTITAGNTPAAGDLIYTRIRRLPDHNHDVLGGNSRLTDAGIQWTDDGTAEAQWQ